MGTILDITPICYIKTSSGKQLFKFHSTIRVGTSGSKYMNTHFSGQSCFVYIKNGRGRQCISNHEFNVETGDFVIIRSMEPCWLRSISDDTRIEVVNIDFDFKQIRELISEFVDPRIVQILMSLDEDFENILDRSNPITQELGRLMLTLEDEFLGDSPDHNFASAKFFEILALVAKTLPRSDSRVTELHKKYDDTIAFSLEYITQNLTRDLTLDDIAREAAMETSLYGEVFREIYGISPWNYVVLARVELAMRYLRETNKYYTVTEVAELCGFRNLSNFNRTFKSRTGMTPSEFRRNG